MKKILCLLLAVMMTVSLCGCFGDNANTDVRGEVVSGDAGQSESQPEFSLGKAANNTYNNAFLGISCTLPAEWTFYTDEQILELNNITEDYMDDDVAELIENASIIYDMYATNATTGENININLEKLNAVQAIALDIKQALEAQINAITSTYENIGYTDITVNYQKVSVDSKEFDALKITAKIQDTDFYGTVFTFKKGNYLANITICSLLTDNFDTISGYFTVE